MDRRHSPRVSVQLPVEVWGLDAFCQPFTDSAIITNMSAEGIVLQGLRRRMREGELLDVRLGREKGQFRVVWIGGDGELGMRSVTSQTFLPNSILVHCSQAAAAC